jgi:hypothetical protein
VIRWKKQPDSSRLKVEREDIKWLEVVRDITFNGGGGSKNIFFFSGFEDSQSVPARPSSRGTFKNGMKFYVACGEKFNSIDNADNNRYKNIIAEISSSVRS